MSTPTCAPCQRGDCASCTIRTTDPNFGDQVLCLCIHPALIAHARQQEDVKFWPTECGESFMAGTLCSLAPGHDGPHGTDCQVCGGDWMQNTCTCLPRCPGCNAVNQDAEDYTYCEDCCCPSASSAGPARSYCQLPSNHIGPHDYTPPGEQSEPSQEEIDATIRSIQSSIRRTIR